MSLTFYIQYEKQQTIFCVSVCSTFGFFVTSHKVEAAVSFNNVGNDCRTVAIANFTTNQGFTNPCWPNSTVSGSAGDVLNVRIYYHNTGTSSAVDTRIKLIQNTLVLRQHTHLQEVCLHQV